MTTERKNDPGYAEPEAPRTDEVSAPEEPKNPWAFLDSEPEEEPEQEDVLRLKDVSKSWLAGYILNKGCSFLIIILGVLIGLGAIFGEIEDRARLNRQYSFDCISRLSQIGKGMYYLVFPGAFGQDKPDPPFELRPEHTVVDLIQELLARGLLREEDLRCRWGEGHPPYLVFPLPASVLVEEFAAPAVRDSKSRIPIVMELPEFHRKSETFWKIWQWLPGKDEYNSSPRVLWADGGAGIITMEEAEKLMAEHPPVPIEFPAKTVPDQE